MDLSFIVPVHATRLDDLDHSIPSIMDSGVESYEIIVIVNGITPEQFNVSKWNDSHINFLYIPQEGPSAARNCGIRVARGDWICYVDSDDSIIPRTLDQLARVGEAHGCDAVIGDFVKVTADGHAARHEAFDHRMTWKSGDALNFLAPVLLPTYQLGYVWARLFSTAFVKENNLLFDENLYFGEDYEYMVRVCLKAANIEYLPVPIYSHNVSLASLTKRFNKLYVSNNFEMLDTIGHNMRQAIQVSSERAGSTQRTFVEQTAQTFYLLILSSIIVDFVFHPDNEMTLAQKRTQFFTIIQDDRFLAALAGHAEQDLDWKHRAIILAAKRKSFVFSAIFASVRHGLLREWRAK